MSPGGAWESATMASIKVAWDASPALVVLTMGPEHELVYQNPASRSLFGPRPLGVPVGDAFPELSPGARTTLDQVLTTGEAVTQRQPRPGVLGAAGEEVLLTYVFAPVGEPGQPPLGVLLTAMDVTAEVTAGRAAEQSALLSELSDRMNDAGDPNEALRQLTRTLVPSVADLAAVFVVARDPESPRIRRADGATDRAPSSPNAMSISPRLLETVGPPPQGSQSGGPSPWEASLAAGRSLLIDIAGGDLVGQSADAVTAWLQDAGAQNMAVLPLSLAGELAGAVVLLAVSPRLPYGATDLPFLELAAAKAGSAVSHLRAFRQQWQIALDLQHALLPDPPTNMPSLDVAARYVAGSGDVDIGGDWWDVHDLGSGRSGVGLGDVCGRGIEAAVVMGHARAAMRAAAMAQLGPSAVLTLLDELLADLLDTPTQQPASRVPPRFATSVYAIIDTRSGTMQVANAGHPPLVVRYPDGRTERVHAPPGPPLGLRAANYEEVQVPFPPGAVLLGFTDGLVESRSLDLESGLSQVQTYLDNISEQTVEEIADHLLEHMTGARELDDDIALVVLQRSTS